MQKIVALNALLFVVLFMACTKEEPIVEEIVDVEEVAINFLQNLPQPVLFQHTVVDEEQARARGFFINKTGDIYAFSGRKSDFVNNSSFVVLPEQLQAIARLGKRKIGTVASADLYKMYLQALSVPAKDPTTDFTTATSTQVNAYLPYSSRPSTANHNDSSVGSDQCTSPGNYTDEELSTAFDARIILGEGRYNVANSSEYGQSIYTWLREVVDYDFAGER